MILRKLRGVFGVAVGGVVGVDPDLVEAFGVGGGHGGEGGRWEVEVAFVGEAFDVAVVEHDVESFVVVVGIAGEGGGAGGLPVEDGGGGILGELVLPGTRRRVESV